MKYFNIITNEEIDKYYKLKKGTQFICRSTAGDFLAVKYNNKYCVMVSVWLTFFVCRVYNNCFTAGAEEIKNFRTYDAAIKHLKEKEGQEWIK